MTAVKRSARFIQSTVIGGVLFLVPIVVVVGILGKAFAFFHKITIPIAQAVPPELAGDIPLPRILAIVAIVLFCFLAGLFSRTKLATRLGEWLESALLSNIPGYTFMKGLVHDMTGVEGTTTREVVLARIEDAWQFAFLIERLPDGQVAVFVPGAPSPLSGSIYLMTADRIKPLDVPAAAAMKCIKSLGLGSGKLTQGRL